MIPVSKPHITEEDISAVTGVLRGGFVSGDAPIVAEFERDFSTAVNRTHGVAVSNGSVALDLAIHALNLTSDDEVIIPSFTIASCLFAVLRSRARPVFADVESTTWNLSVESFQSVITPRTRALIAVQSYGLPIDMQPIEQLCKEQSITIIEDAAEAHNVTYNGKVCGSFGLASTFSFYANKAITCGEGGMIVTDDEQLANRLRQLRNLSFLTPPGPRFVHEETGWNSRLSALQAALGKSQLLRMNAVTAEKRRIGLAYHQILGSHPLVQMQPTATSYSENMYWVVGLVLDQRLDARRVALRLREQGVDSRPFFHPLHRQPVLARFQLSKQSPLPVSERLGAHGLYLPSYIGITKNEILHCAQTLISILESDLGAHPARS